MKKALLLAFILFSVSIAADITGLVGEAETGTGGLSAASPIYQTGIVRDWQALSFILAIITVFLIALARMVADPLNSPELKAWANAELAQAFATVIIVITAITVIEIIDTVILVEVNQSPGSPVHCDVTDFCLQNVSNTYIDGLVDLAKAGARESFTQSVAAARSASQRTTVSCSNFIWPPCLWSYIGWPSNPHMILDSERYNQELEHYSPIITSLVIQKFFVEYIAFLAGPVLLLVGIVARSFFITRRIGGLMIAAALGVMVVFPMMYLWNMITLNVTIYGDKLFENENEGCPKECALTAPRNITAGFDCTTYPNCPYLCRERPYPYYMMNCADSAVELACMAVPDECKITRYPVDKTNCDECPEECRIQVPMEDDCTTCFFNGN
ncbi:hypothetical protein KJ780_02415, partial [Candidatus Micrarchaeota archaeon]|nr:hypothetical protein [Candidatus Micrarchaeota archaeon]